MSKQKTVNRETEAEKQTANILGSKETEKAMDA